MTQKMGKIANIKMAGLNPNISVIALKVNRLCTSVNKQRLSE